MMKEITQKGSYWQSQRENIVTGKKQAFCLYCTCEIGLEVWYDVIFNNPVMLQGSDFYTHLIDWEAQASSGRVVGEGYPINEPGGL